MNQTSKYRTGLRFGLITGIIYVCLLFLRYTWFSSTPTSLFLFSLLGYLFIILIMYLLTGIARKKELGGYGELREIFQSIFITILITELFYVCFNIIYLKYVDPGFIDHFRSGSIAYFRKMDLSQEQFNLKMEGVDSLIDQVKPKNLLKGYATSVVLGSVFGLIFASIIRRKKPVTDGKLQETKI